MTRAYPWSNGIAGFPRLRLPSWVGLAFLLACTGDKADQDTGQENGADGDDSTDGGEGSDGSGDPCDGESWTPIELEPARNEVDVPTSVVIRGEFKRSQRWSTWPCDVGVFVTLIRLEPRSDPLTGELVTDTEDDPTLYIEFTPDEELDPGARYVVGVYFQPQQEIVWEFETAAAR